MGGKIGTKAIKRNRTRKIGGTRHLLPLSALRVVGRSQFLPAELLTQATGYDTQIVREPIRIGSGDVAELVFSWVNWAINSTQTTGINIFYS